MTLAILAVYFVAFLALGVGVMIAVQAQRERDIEPEPGEVPESIEVKRHHATGWRKW